ncbi:hypothetical protein C8Q69DRAFT_509274 [Paecilomyces variotii]|uniref:Uncharacterized protein n=1 Tax=Byssochlamys spectabilis TaxID=264951 RepID=A0A443HND4_BYSSP|nr:hypothetical protein C8Q69DRAFT_509274 [Paecilomyces variotii]KAJ9234917.1 hypothetical protein DTO169E5_6384 [Paecilomyces variotii]KAJ9312644.1 hypothetical protein DTO271D3_7035 [Paecilomyces variotii]KAJ9353913.1 hypothetical protein DTO280E4_7068 [Paecilomyces variotii]RWQ93327.1 hypothetical protein C8Q69DRAFT_509274 [Paecilomyces variotii]
MQLVELCGLWPVILVYGVMVALSTAIETSEAINGGETLAPESAVSTLETSDAMASDVPKFNTAAITDPRPYAGDFPVCTEFDQPYSPFCLPKDGSNVTVDSTYYVTWNPDYYPVNATITIELRYCTPLEGDSAFTSDRTENSYGYIPLKMRQEWLQGKARNNLTLYIIENEPTSNQRASYRQGPRVQLTHRRIEHYKPPPQTPYNKLGLILGLPISVSAVLLVIAGLYFGMRKNRTIGLGNVMGPGNRGYGIRQSKIQRLGRRRVAVNMGEFENPRKYRDDPEGRVESIDGDLYNQMERTRGRVFTHQVSKLKSWSE